MVYVITSSVSDERIIRKSFDKAEIEKELEKLKSGIICDEKYELIGIPDNTTWEIGIDHSINGKQIKEYIAEYASQEIAQRIFNKANAENDRNSPDYRGDFYLTKKVYKETEEVDYSDWNN